MWQKLKPYIIFVGSALAVGGLSALVTGNSMDNYARLVQPPFAPPGWLFPVVWTALFILMGIGAARYISQVARTDPFPSPCFSPSLP